MQFEPKCETVNLRGDGGGGWPNSLNNTPKSGLESLRFSRDFEVNARLRHRGSRKGNRHLSVPVGPGEEEAQPASAKQCRISVVNMGVGVSQSNCFRLCEIVGFNPRGRFKELGRSGLNCLLGLYWTGLTLLNGFSFSVNFFLF